MDLLDKLVESIDNAKAICPGGEYVFSLASDNSLLWCSARIEIEGKTSAADQVYDVKSLRLDPFPPVFENLALALLKYLQNHENFRAS